MSRGRAHVVCSHCSTTVGQAVGEPGAAPGSIYLASANYGDLAKSVREAPDERGNVCQRRQQCSGGRVPPAPGHDRHVGDPVNDDCGRIVEATRQSHLQCQVAADGPGQCFRDGVCLSPASGRVAESFEEGPERASCEVVKILESVPRDPGERGASGGRPQAPLVSEAEPSTRIQTTPAA